MAPQMLCSLFFFGCRGGFESKARSMCLESTMQDETNCLYVLMSPLIEDIRQARSGGYLGLRKESTRDLCRESRRQQRCW